jgi:pimeloyl-ACP methyl ester carboxylesterase
MFLKLFYKKKFIFSVLFACYLLFCQSCMTMRMTKKETKLFFKTAQNSYLDTVISFEKYKLHYIQTGNKNNPTLFFVHGSPGSWDAYKRYLNDSLLLKKYRIIAVDRPGFGYSNFRSAQNLQVQANLLEKLILKIDNSKPVILIGHSMGGPVITKLATINSKLYAHLVILAGALDPVAEKPEKWRKIFKAFPLRYIVPGALRPSNDELWWLKKDLIDMKPDLKNVLNPITLIHGTMDQLVPYSNVAFMQKEFVNAKTIDTISIKNANHFIPWEHYKLIRDTLFDLKF